MYLIKVINNSPLPPPPPNRPRLSEAPLQIWRGPRLTAPLGPSLPAKAGSSNCLVSKFGARSSNCLVSKFGASGPLQIWRVPLRWRLARHSLRSGGSRRIKREGSKARGVAKLGIASTLLTTNETTSVFINSAYYI